MRRSNIGINPAIHKQAKAKTAAKGISLQAYVESLILIDLQKKGKVSFSFKP